jgi:endonuclease YncB( thermonuclease family)
VDRGIRLFWLLVATLVGLSTYFGVQAEQRRRAVQRVTDVDLAPGETVRLARVVDGDTVLGHRASGERIAIRLVGIKSLVPSGDTDPATRVASLAAETLERLLVDQSIHVQLEPPGRDRRGRILASLSVNGTDVGMTLLEHGLAVVYLAYPFTREQEYRDAQAEARAIGRGLWADPALSHRADALAREWMNRRQ